MFHYSLLFLLFFSTLSYSDIQHFVRYSYQGNIQYGKLTGSHIQPISGNIFTSYRHKGSLIPAQKATLLTPTIPQKVFAVGMNFASHISSDSDRPPPLFLKLPTSLIASGKTIKLPKDAKNVHFEGELVLVIGKQAKNISIQEAKDYIFGVTVGNDLTDRDWQGQDLQWLRAKASDGFGPISSTIAVGLDYNNVILTTHLNGEIVQQENTNHMIHKPSKVVSYLSQYFTLMPGDLIFMGTPGRTRALSSGDVVNVTIDGVGTVTNQIK